MPRFIATLVLLLAPQTVFPHVPAKHIIDYSESGESLFFSNLAKDQIGIEIDYATGDRDLLFLIAQDAHEGRITFRVLNPPGSVDPVFSYDDTHWFPVDTSWVEETSFFFAESFDRSSVFVRLVPPVGYSGSGSAIVKQPSLGPPYYDFDRLQSYITSVIDHPLNNAGVLGQSVFGNDIWMFTITDTTIPETNKKTVWAQFRVHGNEMEQSYIFEGLVDYLLSADSSAAVSELLTRLIFKLIPAINPDGVILNTRQNAHNIDLNRIWVDSTNHAAEELEVRWVHDALDNWVLTQGHKIYFALDKHGWGGSRDGGYRTRPEVAGEAYVADQSTFLGYLLHFDPWQRWADWTFSEGHPRMARLALWRQHRLNILTWETTGGSRYDGTETTIESLQEEGSAFVKAVYRYLYHVHFVDAGDREVDSYDPSDSVFVRLEDDDANFDDGAFEECLVTLVSSVGDTENVIVREQLTDAGIFVSERGLPIDAQPPVVHDGMLQGSCGDTISVHYVDADFPDDNCNDVATVVLSTGIAESSSSGQPGNYRLYQNFPNPFNGATSIRFRVPESASAGNRVRLKIVNILGEEICTLVDKVLPAGEHTATWDGRDTYGNAVGSGVYFCRLESPEVCLTKRLLLLR